MSDVVPASGDSERRPELRIGNPEREQVISWLQEALDEGRLEVAEFDERIAAVYAAKTQSELTPVTSDLPPPRSGRSAPPAPEPTTGEREGSGGRDKRRGNGAWVSWATIVLVNVVIWGIVSISGGELVYPWWVWIAGPWGAVLLANTLFGGGSGGRDRGRGR